MSFKEWLKEKEIIIPDTNYLKEIDNIDYATTTIEILEKIYNLLDDKLLDLIGVYKVKDLQTLQYVFTSPAELTLTDIYSLISYLNCGVLLDTVTKSQFIDSVPLSIYKTVNFKNGENFYCLLSLNPNYCSLEHIETVEPILNKEIDVYTDIDKLYNQFTSLINKDARFKQIIQSNFYEFAIICFADKFEMDRYINEDRPALYGMDNKPIKIDSFEELLDLMKENPNTSEVMIASDLLKSEEPEELDMGKVIDFNSIKKNNSLN